MHNNYSHRPTTLFFSKYNRAMCNIVRSATYTLLCNIASRIYVLSSVLLCKYCLICIMNNVMFAVVYTFREHEEVFILIPHAPCGP